MRNIKKIYNTFIILLLSIQIFSQENFLGTWKGELTQDQAKFARQLNNDGDFTSTDLKLITGIFGSRFGEDAIIQNHATGEFVIKGGKDSPYFDAYTEATSAAQKFKRLKKTGGFDKGQSYRLPISGKMIELTPDMEITDVVDQVLIATGASSCEEEGVTALVPPIRQRTEAGINSYINSCTEQTFHSAPLLLQLYSVQL